jgi:hypothetical protein
MNHQCKLDDRGLCATCENVKREQERKFNFQETMGTFRIPDDLPEFPTPYEMGQMESGEWN